MKTIRIILLAAAAIAFAGCSFGNDPEVDTGVPLGLVTASIDMEIGDVNSAGSSGLGAAAVVPHWDPARGVTIEDGANGEIRNYPMRGQVTTYSVTAVQGHTDLFRVVAVTRYPYNEYLDNTTEIYHLKGTEAGFLFTDSSGTGDSRSREQYSTTYAGQFSGFGRDEEVFWQSGITSVSRPTFEGSHIGEENADLDANGAPLHFESYVTYQIRNTGDGLGTRINVDGTREYSQGTIDGIVHERIEVFENGQIINLDWDGRIFRGGTDLEGRITLELENGQVVSRSGQYTLSHGDMSSPLAIQVPGLD